MYSKALHGRKQNIKKYRSQDRTDKSLCTYSYDYKYSEPVLK